MFSDTALQQQARYDRLVQEHLSKLTMQLHSELKEVFRYLELETSRVLRIHVNFDTMGPPFTVDVVSTDGIPQVWVGPENLLDRLTHRPYEFQDDPYWDDEWAGRTMHLIAPWMLEAWVQSGGQARNLQGVLLSYSYDVPEQFNLGIGHWEVME